MSDVALARNLIREIAGDCWNGKADMLHRVHQVCKSHGKNFTLRRLRGWWHMEAAHVRYHEMIELAEVAEAEKKRQRMIIEAQKDHAEFIAQTARLVSLLEHTDEDFHSDQVAAMRGHVGRVGRAGDSK